MPITHEWNGTVLTITSDSGTSSCDLKGAKGDDGCRGAQGKAGIVVANEELATKSYVEELLGDITAPDLTGYATTEYVDAALEGIDLTDYATKEQLNTFANNLDVALDVYATKQYVDAEIAEAQLSGGGSGTVDLSAYATKEYVDTAVSGVKVDLTGYATETYVDNAILAYNVQLGEAIMPKFDSIDTKFEQSYSYMNTTFLEKSKIIYSTTEPTGVAGAIWLKPLG